MTASTAPAAPRRGGSSNDDAQLVFLRRRRYSRVCAMRFLYQADQAGTWTISSDDLTRFWDQVATLEDVPGEADREATRAYAEKLIFGVAQHREAIDERITAICTNWKLDRLATIDRNLLRLAACEILYGDGEVPPLAAIDEAIEIAKEFGDKESSRFINGILDRLLKDPK